MQETWVRSLGWENPLEEGKETTPVFLPEESHGQRSLVGYGQRSLVGYSKWGHKESDMTETKPAHVQPLPNFDPPALPHKDTFDYSGLIQIIWDNLLSCDP